MRPVAAAVVLGLAGIAITGCGAAAHHLAQPPATVVARIPAPAPTPPPAPKPTPAQARLAASLESALRAAGPASGVAVYDITARRWLFSLRGEVPRPPASVEKLYTSLAALIQLGPDAEFQTTVLGTGHLDRRGVWLGNLYLRGGGDPTFGDGAFNRVWEGGYGPTAQQVVAQLRRDGIRKVSGKVIADASLFDSRRGPPSSGFAPDIPDLGGQLAALTYDHGATIGNLSPGGFAVRELALTLRGVGIKARALARTSVTPPDAQPLAAVSSPPVSVLLRLMDLPSDDFFAEMLTKQLGVRFGGDGSTPAGAGVIAQSVDRLGASPKIVDGSGLSRQDQTSPVQVVDVLRSVWATANGRFLLAALPVVGVDGTAQTIAQHTPAQGHCQAKTGTLNYVTNLAGYCQSRGGHVLAFAAFLDGPSNDRGTLLLGRMVAAVARY
ncbi:MAG: D-alanyl-D-alanine carboxypeptidase [Solirubrobacterales bacterium]|nr:D-alanyl-D-alanine carboxypeptidase [Solirubrobacterales bacterium]